jgi:hypothetical protein
MIHFFFERNNDQICKRINYGYPCKSKGSLGEKFAYAFEGKVRVSLCSHLTGNVLSIVPQVEKTHLLPSSQDDQQTSESFHQKVLQPESQYSDQKLLISRSRFFLSISSLEIILMLGIKQGC